MNRDDIEYVLEILEEAIENREWELINEAQQYLKDYLQNPFKYSDDE